LGNIQIKWCFDSRIALSYPVYCEQVRAIGYRGGFIMSGFLRLLQSEDGATVVEYALIVACVAIAGIVAYGALGQATLGLLERAVAVFPGL
jgi:Flp pilus assembly pilin Flp